MMHTALYMPDRLTVSEGHLLWTSDAEEPATALDWTAHCGCPEGASE